MCLVDHTHVEIVEVTLFANLGRDLCLSVVDLIESIISNQGVSLLNEMCLKASLGAGQTR